MRIDYRFSILCVGVCFGIWPIIMSMSGLKPKLASVLLSGISTIVVAIPFVRSYQAETSNIFLKIVAIGVLAGVLNGLGTLQFNKLLAYHLEQSNMIIGVIATQIVVTLVASLIFLKEPITGNKLIGAVLVIAGAKFIF